MALDLLTFDPDHATEAMCREAQRILQIAGYYHDTVDGLFWGDSRAALTHWKADASTHHENGASTLTTLQRAILDLAADFNGLTEIASNSRWAFVTHPGDRTKPDAFRGLLLDVGWQSGWSYCIAAVWGVWKRAFREANQDFTPLAKCVSVSVLDSWHRVLDAGLATSQPVPGAIMFLQHGSTSLGHAGIVRGVQGKTLLTWEANTTAVAGDPNRDREGDMVTNKTRPFDITHGAGLSLLGFINPPGH